MIESQPAVLEPYGPHCHDYPDAFALGKEFSSESSRRRVFPIAKQQRENSLRRFLRRHGAVIVVAAGDSRLGLAHGHGPTAGVPVVTNELVSGRAARRGRTLTFPLLPATFLHKPLVATYLHQSLLPFHDLGRGAWMLLSV